MKLQTSVEAESIKDVRSFLREFYPERYELLENWQELDFELKVKKVGGNEFLILLEVPEEEFEKLTAIFPSPQEAKGAFLTTALEAGWEEFPESFVIYHAEFEEGRLIAGIKTPAGVSKHTQTTLEPMIQTMAKFPRVVVYSSEVITYIKDLYPEVDSKAYVVAREIAKVAGSAPDLDTLGSVYGVDTSTLEGKLELIGKLLNNPVRLPQGEVNLRPYYYPVKT